MPFTVRDVQDLMRVLTLHPEWQAELRRLVLTEELLSLPHLMRELATEVRALAAAQARAEERMDRLEAALERLAAAQARAEERMDRLEAALERLAAAQARTEARVEELAAAQARTEERVDRLEAALERLAAAQARTEEKVDRLGTAVGQLQTAFGATIEEEAESVLQIIVESQGYRLLAEPFSLPLDGEIDVVLPLEAPTGQAVWGVAEAKARLGRRQVRDWAQRIRSIGWQKRLAQAGVPGPYLVYAYGIRIDPGTVQEAERQGIGLATGRGERVAPRAWIHPLDTTRDQPSP